MSDDERGQEVEALVDAIAPRGRRVGIATEIRRHDVRRAIQAGRKLGYEEAISLEGYRLALADAKADGAREENEACERAMGDVMADFIDDAGDALIYRREAIEAIGARRKQP